MKALTYNISALLLVILFSTNLLAKDTELSKKIQKNFKLSDQTVVDLTNKYGSMIIKNWDKNEVSIDVEIIVEMRDKDDAEDLLDRINVNFDVSNLKVSAITEIESKNNSWWSSWTGNSSKKMEINYIVYMPSKNELVANMKYGNMDVEDFSKKVHLTCKYGNLEAGELTGENNYVNVKYGNGSAEVIKSGDLIVKYGAFEAEKMEDIDLESGYSNLEFGTIQKLDITEKYGKVEIEFVDELEGMTKYSEFKIKELGKSVDMTLSYVNDFEVDKVSLDFTEIDITASYSDVEISIANMDNVELDLNASYGDIDLPSSSDNKISKDGNREFIKVKKGAGNQEIEIDNRYGDIEIELY